MSPNIAIIGGGPGGCMLARLLHTHDIPCTIFEGEASIDFRSQGGTLDLRSNTGLAAVRRAGLWDTFQKLARYDGESLLVTDKNLTTWMRRSPSKANDKQKLQEAPEIDRIDLRMMLLESLPERCIQWNMRLARIEDVQGALELHFINGRIERGFDIIVGADGAFSKTRSFLTSERPFYTGLSGWTMLIPDAETNARTVYDFVNRGSVFAYSDGKSMAIQQLSSGDLWVSSYNHYDEDHSAKCGSDPKDLQSVKVALRKQLHDWSPALLNAIEKTEGDATWRSLYMLPVGFTWPHKKGITLLGDAAHLMSPFAGIGVNTAFYDAMLLADEIIAFKQSKRPGTLDEHIVEYEKKMFEHAHKAQEVTQGTMNDMLFTPGAPRTSIESWIVRHAKQDLPSWSHPVLTAVVYVGFWIYKWFV